jgi:hypothetical protein
MFLELNHLSTLIRDKSVSGYTHSEWDAFRRKLDISEQRMFRIIHCELGDVNSPEGSLFKLRAYPISGSIYLYLYLRKIPVGSTALDYFIANLQDSLIEDNVIDDRGTFPPDALLWVLLMGGIASEGRVQRQWFQMRVANIRATLGLSSWRAAYQLLARFPFTGHDCEAHCQRFWGEVA